MKRIFAGFSLAAVLLVSGQAQAGFGTWWMDGDDAPTNGAGVCGTCTGSQGPGVVGAGFASTGFAGTGYAGAGFAGTGFAGTGGALGTGAGLALGFGNGTLPQPQDGTGFGSPWLR